VLIDTEVGFSKPDVRIFEIALQKLSLKPEDVWMIGDNLVWDIEPPQRLGMYAVWNDYRQKGLPENSAIIPDKTVGSIYELAKEVIQSKQGGCRL
jgi:putative hydrolase of the HAD superfamily